MIISKQNDFYVVIKNNKPINLVGVGVLKFTSIEEAQTYINYVKCAEHQIKNGVPE